MTVWIVLNCAGILAVLGFFAWHAFPPTRAVRLRNALLVEPSTDTDFAWRPPHVPATFRLERLRPPEPFARVVADLGVDRLAGDWAKALAIAGHLAEPAQDKGPIQSDLRRTYLRIREGHGYCADFTKVFLALAHAAGILARQWSFSFDGFGGHGHVVVEVYDRTRGKWLFLDVFNNFHAVDAVSGEVLSALEFRDAVLGARGPAERRPNGPGRAGYPIEQKALDYYRRGAREWYLWWGNDVISVESRPFVRWLTRLSGPVGQFAGTALGALPRIRILVTDENAGEAQELLRLGRWTRALAFVLIGLALALAVQALYGGVRPTGGKPA